MQQNTELTFLDSDSLNRLLLLIQIFNKKLFGERKSRLMFILGLIPIIIFLPFFPIWGNTMPGYRITVSWLINNYESGALFSFVIMPPLALILGISAIADEREQNTLSMLNAKPITRQDIITAKFITTNIFAILVIEFVNLITFVFAFVFSEMLLVDLIQVYLRTSAFLASYIVVYVSIFIFVGTFLHRNALLTGFAIAYFEAFFSQFIFGLNSSSGASAFSISNHIYYVASEFLFGDYMDVTISNMNPFTSVVILLVFIGLSYVGAVISLRRQDIISSPT